MRSGQRPQGSTARPSAPGRWRFGGRGATGSAGSSAYDLVAAATLVALVWAAYSPSLDGPFVFDDDNSISQSDLVRSLTPVWRFVAISTRPLTDFSFAVNHALGGLHPRSYHATNILLHALNASLAYALFSRTLALPSLVARYGSSPRLIAWVAAAAFAVHPLTTDAVAYVSSRGEVLAASLMLLTMITYVRAATATGRSARRLAAAALPLLMAAALASKETAVMTPALLLVWDWCFLAGGRVRDNLLNIAMIALAVGSLVAIVMLGVLYFAGQDTRIGLSAVFPLGLAAAIAVGFGGAVAVPAERWKLIALACAPFVLGGALILYRSVSPTGLGDYGQSAGLMYERIAWPVYLMTQFGVIVHYLRLVIVPSGLSFDYDWPPAQLFAAPEVSIPFLLLVVLGATGLATARRQPVLTFAVLGMFVMLAPTSSFLPLADFAAERRMYLPLTGLMLLAATLVWDVGRRFATQRSRFSPKLMLVVSAMCAVTVMLLVTRSRAALWADPVALHLDAAAKAPGNPRVRLNVGVIYLNQGLLGDAERELAEAKRLYDRGTSTHASRRIGAFIHYNLGAVLYLRNRSADAVPHLERSLILGGQYLALRPMALYLLGRIAFAARDWETAVRRIDEALRYNNRDPGWFIELASAQLQWQPKQTEMARQTLARGLVHHPDHPQLLRALNTLPLPVRVQ